MYIRDNLGSQEMLEDDVECKTKMFLWSLDFRGYTAGQNQTRSSISAKADT